MPSLKQTQAANPKIIQSIRMPADLREYLQAQADANTRSLSAEIVHRLRMSQAAEKHEETN